MKIKVLSSFDGPMLYLEHKGKTIAHLAIPSQDREEVVSRLLEDIRMDASIELIEQLTRVVAAAYDLKLSWEIVYRTAGIECGWISVRGNEFVEEAAGDYDKLEVFKHLLESKFSPGTEYMMRPVFK